MSSVEIPAAGAAAVRSAAAGKELVACWLSAVKGRRQVRVSHSFQGELEKIFEMK